MSALLSLIAATGALYFTTSRYEQAARQLQVVRVGYTINRYVDDFIWHDFADTIGDLARDIAQQDEFKKAIATDDRVALAGLLPQAWRRNAVSSGHIRMLGITVYRNDGSVMAAQAPQTELQPVATLSELLAHRSGTERFVRLHHVWTQDGAPRLTIAVPVGGFKLTRYLAVDVDPLAALDKLDERLGMHIVFSSSDGAKKLSEMQNFKFAANATLLHGDVRVTDPSGQPIARAAVSWDETTMASQLTHLRRESFTILIAILSALMLVTLALVLMVSRQMARAETLAATALMTAKQAATEDLLRAEEVHAELAIVHAVNLRVEKERSEKLLLNILPKAIVARLHGGETEIANYLPNVTILFSDLVGFTKLSASLSAPELVHLMNRLFSEFDHLSQKFGVEKIKTIGDAYMLVGGLPEPRADHAAAVADMALAMIAAVEKINLELSIALQMRIGIHSGDVVAGIIGTHKFAYDIWGDSVNIASRMESHSLPDRIQVSYATYELLNLSFDFESHGTVDVKGKGAMDTYFLLGRRATVLATRA